MAMVVEITGGGRGGGRSGNQWRGGRGGNQRGKGAKRARSSSGERSAPKK